MIVGFLDLLGFSALVKTDIEVALDNMHSFNNIIKTKFVDSKYNQTSEYKNIQNGDINSFNFFKNSSVTAFKHMISFSDSLVLGGMEYDLFIMQLANFVATAYIEYTEPFRKTFTDINAVLSNKVADVSTDNGVRNHKASPLLFRGGVSVGEDVLFFNIYNIDDDRLSQSSLNIIGSTYLNAVKLESYGKGPRIFCDKSVVDVINEKTRKNLKKVDEEKGIYEIVWTIVGCEAMDNSSNKWKNVVDSIDKKMLPAAINLYEYYREDEDLKVHYEELLRLVCQGIVKYATDECNRTEEARTLIRQRLPNGLLIEELIPDNCIF